MRIHLVLLSLFVVCCFAENDIYVGGDFILTIMQDDGNLDHVASLVSYNPDEDVYYDTFEGGVFQASGYLDVLKETPLGIFGAGVFTFTDDDHDYTNSVVKYNNDDDDFETVNDGIYIRTPGDSIRYIAGTDKHTFFAGTFSSVEYISLQSDDPVTVNNIVKLNSDEEWSLLEDSGNVFPSNPFIVGLVASDDKAFIYAKQKGSTDGGALYSWDDDSDFQFLASASLQTDKGIVIDSNNNVAGTAFEAGVDADGTFQLVVFHAGENYTPAQTINLYQTENQCTTLSPEPIITGYLEGFLIAAPNVDDGCNQYQWAYYNSTAKTIDPTYTAVPNVREIDMIEVGKDGDLWVATTSSSVLLYLPFGGVQWVEVDLSVYGEFTIKTMAWDDGPDKLLVFGSTANGMKFVEVEPQAFPPIVKEKNPGTLYRQGTINALAVVNDPDDDDFELVIGGNFDSIGNHQMYSNFVLYKDGKYDSPLPNVSPISALATEGSVVFYATTTCAANNHQLPIGYYSSDGRQDSVWTDIPVVIGGSGCVDSLLATDQYVFVGGYFSVQYSLSGSVGHGVIYYDRAVGTWTDIGIPNNASSSVGAYEIADLDIATIDGTTYLAIGGHFDFTIGSTEYHSFAMYDLTNQSWISNQDLEFATDTIVDDIVINDLDSIYIAGQLKITNGPDEEGVFVYDMNTNSYAPIGDLPTYANSIILYNFEQDDVDMTNVYAGGNFNNGTQHTGLGYISSSAGPTALWNQAAETSQYMEYYMGDVFTLIYTTGGFGANDTNGYEPSYTPPGNGDSSDSGMSGWGIFFLTAFILLSVVVIIGVAAGGGYVYFKKRNNYQEL